MLNCAVTAALGFAVVGAEICRLAGAKLQVMPVGSVVAPVGPAQERLIKPVKLLMGVIVTWVVPEAPTFKDSEVGFSAGAEKSGGAVASGCTLTLSEVEATCPASPLYTAVKLWSPGIIPSRRSSAL